VAQHGRCGRPHLHQTDLATRAHGMRVVRAFDLRHGVSHFKWDTALLSFLSDEPHMCETAKRR
jgi:hypothetical protein